MSVTRMDALEIRAFLETQRTGVLSLARDDQGYGIPISFAYAGDEQALYFRLGYTGESQKRRYVESTRQAAFVVYGETDAGWQSVIAIGPLEAVAESTVDSSVAAAVRDVDVPFFAVHDRTTGELEFELTRLEPDSLSGIVEG